MPSHQTPPSGVSATLVKMVFFASVAIAFGLVLTEVPGATPKKPASGLMARRRPFGIGLDPGDVVADGPDLPAVEAGGRNQHGEIRLAAGAGKRRGDVGLLALRILDAEDQHVLGHPAFVARDVRGDAQREAFLAQQRVAAVAGTVGPDLARFREMDDVLFLVAGPRHILLAGRERRADASACTGTTRLTSLSISWNTGRPMRAMMRMLTTTYGESVSCTPICDIGEPTGPMLKGSTYIVRPRMQPLKQALQLACASRTGLPSCWWGRRRPSRASR